MKEKRRTKNKRNAIKGSLNLIFVLIVQMMNYNFIPLKFIFYNLIVLKKGKIK